MAKLLSAPVRFIFIYRGYIQRHKLIGATRHSEMRLVRFDSFIRQVDPHQYYDCVDLNNLNVYTVKGSNILNYHLYNIRPLTKSDPEYIDPTLQTV